MAAARTISSTEKSYIEFLYYHSHIHIDRLLSRTLTIITSAATATAIVVATFYYHQHAPPPPLLHFTTYFCLFPNILHILPIRFSSLHLAQFFFRHISSCVHMYFTVIIPLFVQCPLPLRHCSLSVAVGINHSYPCPFHVTLNAVLHGFISKHLSLCPFYSTVNQPLWIGHFALLHHASYPNVYPVDYNATVPHKFCSSFTLSFLCNLSYQSSEEEKRRICQVY